MNRLKAIVAFAVLMLGITILGAQVIFTPGPGGPATTQPADPFAAAQAQLSAIHAADQATIATLQSQVQHAAQQPATRPNRGWLMINGCVNASYSINRWADAGHNASGFYSIGGNPFTYSPHGYPVGNGIAARANLGMLGCLAGDYTVTWQGNAAVKISGLGGVTWKTTGPNSGILTLPAECVLVQTQWGPSPSEACTIDVPSSDPANPLDQLHIWSPGYGPGSKHDGQAYDARYLSLLSGFCGYRAMNDEAIVYNCPQTWAARVQPDQWDRTSFGVAPEDLVELAKEARFRRLWVCVPFTYTPADAAQMAAFFHDHLPAGVQLIVEPANELWNWNFAFRKKLDDTAQANPTAYNGYGVQQTTDPNLIDPRVAAEWGKSVCDPFKAAFADRPDDCRCVFCGQASWNLWADAGLGWLQAKYGSAAPFDAIGIAPYYGYGLNPPTLDALYTTVNAWMADNTAAGNGLGYQVGQHTALVPKYHLCEGVWDYEGDQHLPTKTLADGKTPDTASPTYLFQLDPRTRDTQDLYFASLHHDGIVLHCSFAFLESDWDKFGFWPVLRSYGDDTPRWDAMQRESLRSN